MQSNAIQDSLSHILKSPITYITQVEQNETKFFMCIGSHSFFLIDYSLETSKAEVFYAHIQRLMLDTSRHKLLLIQLSDNRSQEVPTKLILSTENRKTLVEHLKSSWKTDHMFRLGRVLDLPVFQALVSVPSTVHIAKKTKIPYHLFEPYNKEWRSCREKGYEFFIPDNHTQYNPNDLTFINAQKKASSKLFVQISGDIPIDTLSYMEGKEQVNTYCEEYATKLVANEPKVLDFKLESLFEAL